MEAGCGSKSGRVLERPICSTRQQTKIPHQTCQSVDRKNVNRRSKRHGAFALAVAETIDRKNSGRRSSIAAISIRLLSDIV